MTAPRCGRTLEPRGQPGSQIRGRPATVQRLSAGSGLDIGKLLPLLAMFLPQIVNMLTPDGKVPSGGVNQAAGNADLGGLLGGLLGGAGGSGGAGGMGDLIGGLGGMLGGNKN